MAAARNVQDLSALDWGGCDIKWPITIWGSRAEMGAQRVWPWR